jgi:hypothetical protein
MIGALLPDYAFSQARGVILVGQEGANVENPFEGGRPPASLNITLSPVLEAALQRLFQTDNAAIARIESKLDAFILLEGKQMAALDDQITALTTEVTNDTTVVGSALTAINGIQAQVAAGVAAALAAGATPAQLAALSALDTTLQTNNTALANAVAANTAANTPPVPAPVASARKAL